MSIWKTENGPCGKGMEIVFSALISLIVCAEMWLIIKTVNAKTQMITLQCQTKALNKGKVALEVHISLFPAFNMSLSDFLTQILFLHAVF